MTEIVKMFQNLGDLENVAGAHLVGKIFEAIFPVRSGGRKVVGQSLKKRFAFDRCNRTPQPNF